MRSSENDQFASHSQDRILSGDTVPSPSAVSYVLRIPVFLVLLAGVAASLVPLVAKLSLGGGSSFYVGLDLAGAIFTLMTGLGLAGCCCRRDDWSYLVVGWAFFLGGVIDLTLAILAMPHSFQPDWEVSTFPVTVLEHLALSLLVLAGCVLTANRSSASRSKRELFRVCIVVGVLAIGLFGAGLVSWPPMVDPQSPLPRPICLIPAAVLLVLSVVFFGRERRGDTMAWWLAVSMILAALGQTIVAMGVSSEDPFFQVGHYYALAARILPLIGVAMCQVGTVLERFRQELAAEPVWPVIRNNHASGDPAGQRRGGAFAAEESEGSKATALVATLATDDFWTSHRHREEPRRFASPAASILGQDASERSDAASDEEAESLVAMDESHEELPPTIHKILLVEDSTINQRLACALLATHGHQVTVANNGCEALEAVKAQEFDLALMDIQMPQMDGIQTTLLIRARETVTGGHLPIIAMTAHSLKADRKRCLDAGMDGYVAKPIRTQELLDALKTVTSARQEPSPPAEAKPEATPVPERSEPVVSGAFALASASAAAMQAATAPAAETSQEIAGEAAQWPALLEAVQGDPDLFYAVVEAAAKEIPRLLLDVDRAVTDRNGEALRLAAHTLMGSLRYFEAGECIENAHRLETMAFEGDPASLKALCDSLHHSMPRVVSALRQFVAQRKRPSAAT